MNYQFIVFSFNRPLQLHALLMSSIHVGKLNSPIVVLYDCEEGYADAYTVLRNELSNENVRIIRRNRLKISLLDVMKDSSVDRVIFLGDDNLFLRSCPMSVFDQYEMSDWVPSLRLGAGKSYCYYEDRSCLIPRFILEGDLIEWPWGCGREFGDYTWPFSCDGHVYDRIEMLSILENIDFDIPNQIERGWAAWNEDFRKRWGSCFIQERIVNISHNRVQKVDNSRCMGRSPEDLLKVWNEGMRIRYEEFSEKSFSSVFIESDFSYVKREA